METVAVSMDILENIDYFICTSNLVDEDAGELVISTLDAEYLVELLMITSELGAYVDIRD